MDRSHCLKTSIIYPSTYLSNFYCFSLMRLWKMIFWILDWSWSVMLCSFLQQRRCWCDFKSPEVRYDKPWNRYILQIADPTWNMLEFKWKNKMFCCDYLEVWKTQGHCVIWVYSKFWFGFLFRVYLRKINTMYFIL